MENKDITGVFMKYWQFLSTIGGLIIALIYFIIDNANSHKIIANLSESNRILSDKVAKLEGHKEGVDNAVKLFMENPPGLLNFRIRRVEKRLFGEEFMPDQVTQQQNSMSSR